MSIVQILLVGLVAFIAAIDQFDLLESLHQPLVTGTCIGFILGNPELGLKVGGLYQLVQIGSVPVGGSQPPNVVIGGIMATVFAITTNIEAQTAIGLAVPFAIVGQLFVTLLFTLRSPMMAMADKAAEEANPRKIESLTYTSSFALGAVFALIIMVGAASGSTLGQTLSNLLEQYRLVQVLLQTFGGLLKYIGFAILLSIMISADLWLYFFLGFCGATVLAHTPGLGDASLIIIAVVGAALGFNDYQSSVRIKEVAGSRSVGGDEDGI